MTIHAYLSRRKGDRAVFKLAFLLTSFTAMSFQALAAGPVRSLLNQNRLDEALAMCRQFDVMNTSDTDNQIACAWTYYRADKPQSAERLMEKLSRSSSSAAEFQLLGAFAKIKQKRFVDAKSILNSLSNEYKSGTIATEIQQIMAELYEAEGQQDTAAFLYKQIVNDNPNVARAHWGLGRYYLAKGEIPHAKSELEDTAKLWPRHLGSRYDLAVLALGQENYAEAAHWLAECYKLNRADSGVLEQMGILFEKKGKIALALKYWERALDYNKDSTLAKEKISRYGYRLVDLLMQRKDWNGALAKLQMTPPAMRKDPAFRLKKGIIYRNLGKFKKAIPELLAYTKSNPNSPLALRELGICYLNTHLASQAGMRFARAAEIEPQNGLNFAWLGFVLELKGKLAEAREAWKKSLELLTDPEQVQKATRRLASVERKLNKKKSDDEAREKPLDEEHDVEKEIESQKVFDGVDGIDGK